jgi:hypothetical protein
MRNKLNLTPLIFILIIIIYYYQLELASLLYLGINVLINNLESISNYLKDYLEIDNPIKEISEDNKLIDNNLNKSSITIDETKESIPFYKSKSFIICGIVIISSTLLYLYFNNSYNNDNKVVNKLLDIIYQKDIDFYENNNKLVDIIEEKDKLLEQLRESNINLLEEKVQLLEGELNKTHRQWEQFRDHINNILD